MERQIEDVGGRKGGRDGDSERGRLKQGGLSHGSVAPSVVVEAALPVEVVKQRLVPAPPEEGQVPYLRRTSGNKETRVLFRSFAAGMTSVLSGCTVEV